MADPAEDEVRSTFNELVSAINSGDVEALASLMLKGKDHIHIGSEDSEWWSADEFLETFSNVNVDQGVTAEAGEVGVHVRGNVAWVEGQGYFKNASGGERGIRLQPASLSEGTTDGGSRCSHMSPYLYQTTKSSFKKVEHQRGDLWPLVGSHHSAIACKQDLSARGSKAQCPTRAASCAQARRNGDTSSGPPISTVEAAKGRVGRVGY